MALIYKTIQSTLPNEEGQKLYHPRAVYTGNVDTAQIAREVAAYSSLTTGDVKNTIDNLVTVMTTHLQASESVTLEGLGTFRLVMRSRGMGVATAAEVTPTQAALRVHFTPASTRNQDRTVATRSLLTGVKCVPWKGETTSTGSSQPGGGGSQGGGGEDPLG